MIKKIRMNNKGLSLTEMMVAIFILAVAIVSVMGVLIPLLELDRNTESQADIHIQGMNVLERIERGEQSMYGIMKSRLDSITISPDQRTITFDVDKNASYTSTTSDDITMSIAFDNGDGDDTTIDDNVLILDPNTSISGDEMTIGQNVLSVAFTQDTRLINVQLSLRFDDRGQFIIRNFQRTIRVRN